MTRDPLHVVFAGGGTGGHLFPGLAVAEQLAEQVPHVRITFVGSGKRFERRHVALAGLDYLGLPCRRLSGRMRETFSFVVENLAGYLAAGHFLGEERVAAVIGLGSYASFPMALAASRRGGQTNGPPCLIRAAGPRVGANRRGERRQDRPHRSDLRRGTIGSGRVRRKL